MSTKCKEIDVVKWIEGKRQMFERLESVIKFGRLGEVVGG